MRILQQATAIGMMLALTGVVSPSLSAEPATSDQPPFGTEQGTDPAQSPAMGEPSNDRPKSPSREENPARAQQAPTGATDNQAMPSETASTDDLIGHDVFGTNGEPLGKVDSLLIDSSGRVDKLVLGMGGLFGIGERKVAVDWADIALLDGGREIIAHASPDTLKSMPEYKRDKSADAGANPSQSAF